MNEHEPDDFIARYKYANSSSSGSGKEMPNERDNICSNCYLGGGKGDGGLSRCAPYALAAAHSQASDQGHMVRYQFLFLEHIQRVCATLLCKI